MHVDSFMDSEMRTMFDRMKVMTNIANKIKENVFVKK